MRRVGPLHPRRGPTGPCAVRAACRKPSQEALRRAELTRSTVTAVTAWEYPPGSIGRIDGPQELRTSREQAVARELDDAVAKVVRPGSGPPVEKWASPADRRPVVRRVTRDAPERGVP